MKLNPFDTAPRDGTPILVIDVAADGVEYSASVRFVHHDKDIAESIGEEGYWAYSDALLNEAAPDGPEQPFEWYPDPVMDARKARG